MSHPKTPPLPEPVEFLEGIRGTSITWVFWLLITFWLIAKCRESRKQSGSELRPFLSYEALAIGAFWGVVEFAYCIVIIGTWLTSTGAADPRMTLWDAWLTAYATLWVLIECLVVTVVVSFVRIIKWKKINQPNKAREDKRDDG